MLANNKEGRVMVGDCLEILAGLPDACADVIITDPPYPSRKDLLGARGRLREWMAPWPRLAPLAVVKWSSAAIQEAVEALPPDWKLLHVLAWHKPFSRGRIWGFNLMAHWEPVLVLGPEGARRQAEKAALDALSCNPIMRGNDPEYHPARMPDAVAEWLVAAWSQEGGLVLDPFLGGGSVAVACERLGRRWIGAEISPIYAALAEAAVERARRNGGQGTLPLFTSAPCPAPATKEKLAGGAKSRTEV